MGWRSEEVYASPSSPVTMALVPRTHQCDAETVRIDDWVARVEVNIGELGGFLLECTVGTLHEP